MTQLAVISDTHIPERADAIPSGFEDRIAAADHVVHAGDFTTPDVLDAVRGMASGPVTAVYGNMDPRNLDLPAVDTLSVDGATFVVTHGTGDLETYEERVAGIVTDEAGEDAIGISGHTHQVLDGVVDGVRLLNPGSVTGAAPATGTTMMTVDVDGDEVDVTVHEH